MGKFKAAAVVAIVVGAAIALTWQIQQWGQNSSIAAADVPFMLVEQGIASENVREPQLSDGRFHTVGVEAQPGCYFSLVWDGNAFVVVAASLDKGPIGMIEPQLLDNEQAQSQLDGLCFAQQSRADA